MSLEREIEDLLAVDPSPEFVAKVRRRIAAEPAPAAWWLSWRLATAGAGLAIVVMAAVLWPTSAPVAPTSATDVASTSAAGAASADKTVGKPAPATDVATVGKPIAPVAPASPSRNFAPSNHPASAAVLVQRDEAAAMNLLLTRVREGVLPDMTEALAAVDETGPRWIDIPAVVIEPIATGEGE